MSLLIYNVRQANAAIGRALTCLGKDPATERRHYNAKGANERLGELLGKIPQAKHKDILNGRSEPVKANAVGSSKETEQLRTNLDSALTQIRALESTVIQLKDSAKQDAISAPKPWETGKLESASRFVFGDRLIQSLHQRSESEADFRDLIERQFHFHNVEIPGHSFAHIQAKWGESKPSVGFRRIETANFQERLRAWISKQPK